MADTVTQDLFRQVQQLEQDLTIMAEGLARIGFALQAHLNESRVPLKEGKVGFDEDEQNGQATNEGMPEAPVPETGIPAPFTGTPYDPDCEED